MSPFPSPIEYSFFPGRKHIAELCLDARQVLHTNVKWTSFGAEVFPLTAGNKVVFANTPKSHLSGTRLTVGYGECS